jgi:type IV pilus assembly protein PilV
MIRVSANLRHLGNKMNRYPTSLASNQKGAVLLESLIAILIFSFGVLALAGLQAAMIKNTDDAKYRAEAAFIAQNKITEIWIDGTALAAHVVTDDPVALLPGGLMTVVAPGSEIKITVNWTPPGGIQHTYITNARVEGI